MDSSWLDQHPPGRVVKLHFTCRAELPLGSVLRVTGSTLWAPTSLTSPQDPMNAHHIAQERSAEAFPARQEDDDVPTENMEGMEGMNNYNWSSLYTSSVEMVTTPETYPLWKTRRPVIVVLHKNAKQIQHHYYRYLVVTPGAGGAGEGANNTLQESNNDLDDLQQQQQQAALASTTSEFGPASSPVMMWENPFATVDRNTSVHSLSSSTGTSTNTHHPIQTMVDLANLPYRTLDLNVEMASVMAQEEDRLDGWNCADDASFRPYQIRDSMQQQESSTNNTNTYKMQMLNKQVSDASNDSFMADAEQQQHNHPNTTRGGQQSSAKPNNNPSQRIFFVCFHLPVVVVKSPITNTWSASWSESLLAQKEGSKIVANYRAHWIGTITPHPPIQSCTEDDRKAIVQLLNDMECTPIFLDPLIQQAHYYGFCKQVLWPAFHNIDLLDLSASGLVSGNNKDKGGVMMADADTMTASDWDQSRLDHWWRAYQTVNQEFANIVNSLVDREDYLWIHDYHLSLLPRYLSAVEPGRYCHKVFFLHIPFPTSQIFRELECGEAILEGMLHADVVGFHAFDHARHFLNAAKRILGLNYESLVGGLIGVNFLGKTVLVSMSNVSIEPKMADVALALPSVQTNIQALKDKHGPRIIIGGVDIGQRLSGTSLKLLAYERLLQDYPSWQNKVVMVQRVLLPGSRKADEALTTREIRALVKRIGNKYGSAVIDYQEIVGSSLPMDQRLALWKASDVLMCTPIREGLNHWPMEYIYARDKENPGVVIASEFSAVCSILNGALRVNPFDIQMTITIIDKALSMDKQEREGRRYRDIDFVSNSPSDKWVRNVLRDLKDATKKQHNPSANNSSSASPTFGTPTTPRMSSREQLQGTAAFLFKESNAAFTHMNMRSLKKAYDTTTRRVIILDFNGTIVLKEPPGKYLKREILGTSGNKPPPQVLESLAMLCADDRNTVYVVSGDSSENVLNALDQIPGLGLAVSNGAKFSPPLQDGESERRWQTFDLGVDWDAVKRVALPVLSKYTARSNGSFVKLTTFSIGWSYYSCDPEWGSLQASHLVLELESHLKAFDVRFVTLKGIVEILPRKLNKGLIVKKVLRDIARQSADGVDFIMCLGDDVSDEKMFTSCFSFIAEMEDEAHATPGPPVVNEDGTHDEPMEDERGGSHGLRDPMYCYTVAVGKKPSHASMYVTDALEVANALVVLAKGDYPTEGVPAWGRESATHLFT